MRVNYTVENRKGLPQPSYIKTYGIGPISTMLEIQHDLLQGLPLFILFPCMLVLDVLNNLPKFVITEDYFLQIEIVLMVTSRTIGDY